MNRTEIVLRELERITSTDEVCRDLDIELYEEGLLDSLGTIELLLALSESLNIQISPIEVDRQQWATPRKIIAFLEQKVASQA